MQLQTKIKIDHQSLKIGYRSKILLLGSCFAEYMAKKFDYFKFQHTLNPFGIIFHPLVLERLIGESAVECSDDSQNVSKSETQAFHFNNRWHSFNAHSKLSASSKQELLQNIDTASKTLNASIKYSSHIIITLGTAWGYVHNDIHKVVANCHKLPQQHFEKKRFSVEDISDSLKSISETIQKQNPSAKIIFTVSPVRHIKDGFVGNMLSKAHLIAAAHHTISATENTCYFPAYEIIMDELRDYRFYAEDMLHPNQTAIDYIWERFSETWISEDAISTSKKIEDIQKGLAHRPFNPESVPHQKFQENLQKKIESLKKEFPQIQF